MKIVNKLLRFDFKKLDGQKAKIQYLGYDVEYNDLKETSVKNYVLSFKLDDIKTPFKIRLLTVDDFGIATGFNKRALLVLASFKGLLNPDANFEEISFDTDTLKDFKGKTVNCTVTVDVDNTNIIWLIPCKLNKMQNAILENISLAKEYARQKQLNKVEIVSLDTMREQEFNKPHETGNDW